MKKEYRFLTTAASMHGFLSTASGNNDKLIRIIGVFSTTPGYREHAGGTAPQGRRRFDGHRTEQRGGSRLGTQGPPCGVVRSAPCRPVQSRVQTNARRRGTPPSGVGVLATNGD